MSEHNIKVSWDAAMPATPPMPEVSRPPVAPLPVSEIPARGGARERITGSKLFRKSAVALGSLSLAIGLGVGAANLFPADHKGKNAQPVPAAAEVNPQIKTTETCPEGVFPNGPYESTNNAFTPTELVQRPESPLTDNTFAEFYFGKAPGVVCRSTEALAAYSAVYTNMLGAGNVAQGFGGVDADKLAAEYKQDPQKALRDVKVMAPDYEKATINTEAITGAWYRVGVETTGDAQSPYKIKYYEAAANAAPGSVYQLGWEQIVADRGTEGVDKDQMVFFDKTTGQMFVRKAIGSNIEKMKSDETTTTTAQGQSGGETGQGTDRSGINVGPNGESQPNGPSLGPGEGPTSEAKPGNDNTPGTGNGGGGGTGGGTPTTRGGTPTTAPPYTPPTTETPPPTTPPTTRPTTTTTNKPKGSDPGCPPGAPCN